MFFRQDRLSFVGEGQCPAFPIISFPLCCRQRRTASGKRVENRPSDRQILQICRMIFSGFTSCAQLGIIRRPPLCLAFRLVVPAYPALSRSFPYMPPCDMECAPPHRQRPTLPGDFACLNPAQRAAVKILTKYNAAHWLGQSEKIKLSGCMKRKDPPFRAGLFFSWNPATSYSPRSSPTKYHRR